MSKGKYSRKAGFNVRPLVLMLAVALLIGATIGGTIAWLTAQTPDVTNTFTVGDVALTLKETEIKWTKDADGNETGEYTYGALVENTKNNYKLIPGEVYTKDPVVTVNAESEDCYLFVEVVEKNTPKTYLTYNYTMTKENGWTQFDQTATIGSGDITTVWYRVVKKTDTEKSFNLLEKDQIAIKDTVVKAGTTGTDVVPMPAADKTPNLIFTAYAVQTANLTVDQAWAEVNKVNS